VESSRNAGNGVYIGRRFKIDNSTNYFNGGGPGYVLDRVALEKLGNAFWDADDPCNGKDAKLVDDVPIGECLLQFGIAPYDARDENKRELFHHFSSESVGSLEFGGLPVEQSWWGTHYVGK
jgi:hypothetical protein